MGMRRLGLSLLPLLLSLAVASAEDGFFVDKVSVTGARSVPTRNLLAVIKERTGRRVAKSDIIADQDAISALLAQAGVVGKVSTGLMNRPNGHVEVMFSVDDQGIQTPQVIRVAPSLREETFDGNVRIDSESLARASGLSPGISLTNESLSAAQEAITAAYKSGQSSVSASVSGNPEVVGPGKVDVHWHIVEAQAEQPSAGSETASDDAPTPETGSNTTALLDAMTSAMQHRQPGVRASTQGTSLPSSTYKQPSLSSNQPTATSGSYSDVHFAPRLYPSCAPYRITRDLPEGGDPHYRSVTFTNGCHTVIRISFGLKPGAPLTNLTTLLQPGETAGGFWIPPDTNAVPFVVCDFGAAPGFYQCK